MRLAARFYGVGMRLRAPVLDEIAYLLETSRVGQDRMSGCNGAFAHRVLRCVRVSAALPPCLLYLCAPVAALHQGLRSYADHSWLLSNPDHTPPWMRGKRGIHLIKAARRGEITGERVLARHPSLPALDAPDRAAKQIAQGVKDPDGQSDAKGERVPWPGQRR